MAEKKSRKASNSSFLPLMLLIFMLMYFNTLIKLLLFVPQGEDLSFFSFVRGTNTIQKLSSFKSNENIHKREDGSYYVVSANKASSVTL